MPLEKQRSFEDSALWQLKLRLQFSGWLQYIVHAILVLALLLIAGIGWLFGFWPILLFWIPLVMAILLTVALIGTILIVKYGLHPAESIPSSKNHLDTFDLMRARHSCRSFQSRNLTPAHHQALMDAVKRYTQLDQLLGQYPIRFAYVSAPLSVWPVVGAHEFLVAIAPKEYNRLSVIDVGRSLQKVVMDATRMGLATCWIGPGADQKSIVTHLAGEFDADIDHVICVCAVGYESLFKPLMIRLQNFFLHKRLPLSQLFFADVYCQQPLDTHEPPFSEYGRCYEVCQWSPSSYNGQTTRCAAVIESNGTLTRFDFFAATKSRYYAPVALGIWCANWEIGCDALKKHGHFTVLSPEERAHDVVSDLPHYDVSWIVD